MTTFDWRDPTADDFDFYAVYCSDALDTLDAIKASILAAGDIAADDEHLEDASLLAYALAEYLARVADDAPAPPGDVIFENFDATGDSRVDVPKLIDRLRRALRTGERGLSEAAYLADLLDAALTPWIDDVLDVQGLR